MVTAEQLSELEKLSAGQPLLKLLLDDYKVLIESPFAGTYLGMLKQVNDWNSQVTQNQIDLYGEKELKEFDRVTKYFSNVRIYIEQLDYLRSKMKPEEIKKADTDAKTPYERALQIDGSIT